MKIRTDKAIIVLLSAVFAVTVALTAYLIADENEREEERIPTATFDSAVSLDTSETELLTRFVAAEGEGQPFLCKVCIAAVVINRIEDENFPSALVNVVFDKNDFRSVHENTLGEKRGEREMYVADKAVETALTGQDPTSGALYFAFSEDKEAKIPEKVLFAAGDMVFWK